MMSKEVGVGNRSGASKGKVLQGLEDHSEDFGSGSE